MIFVVRIVYVGYFVWLKLIFRGFKFFKNVLICFWMVFDFLWFGFDWFLVFWLFCEDNVLFFFVFLLDVGIKWLWLSVGDLDIFLEFCLIVDFVLVFFDCFLIFVVCGLDRFCGMVFCEDLLSCFEFECWLFFLIFEVLLICFVFECWGFLLWLFRFFFIGIFILCLFSKGYCGDICWWIFLGMFLFFYFFFCDLYVK